MRTVSDADLFSNKPRYSFDHELYSSECCSIWRDQIAHGWMISP